MHMMDAGTETTLKELLRRMEVLERKLDIVIHGIETLEEESLTEDDIKELQEIKDKISQGDYSDFIPISEVSFK